MVKKDIIGFIKKHRLKYASILTILIILLGILLVLNRTKPAGTDDWMVYDEPKYKLTNVWLPLNDNNQVDDSEICSSNCYQSDTSMLDPTNIILSSNLRFGSRIFFANTLSNSYLKASDCPNVFHRDKSNFIECRKIGEVNGQPVYHDRSVLSTSVNGYVAFGNTIVIFTLVDGDQQAVLNFAKSLKSIKLSEARKQTLVVDAR